MIHELFPQEFPDSVNLSAAKRASIARADHVICISENTRQDAIRLLDVDPERSSVIYLGNSFPQQEWEGGAGATSRPYVLYVGNRSGYKNFQVLARAFAASALLSREMDLVAFGGGAFTHDEQQLLESLRIGPRARQVVGSDLELANWYRGASMFVYPSRYEGFGIPPLEAMANSCPVVCSTAAPMPEVVGDAALYFDPDDPDALRQLLETVATDSSVAGDLRVRGRRQVARYSWQACAQNTLGTYRRLLEGTDVSD